MNFIIPPLPSQWPYHSRNILGSYKHANAVILPGSEGMWRLETCSDLTFCEQESRSELAFGRGGVSRFGAIVLRPYKRGGLVRLVNTSTYLGSARFQNEFHVHKAIWQSGLPTVKPIGWAYKKNSLGTEGVFLTEFTEGTPWPYAWNHSEDFLIKLVTVLKALCRWGLYAPDLNATNIIVSPSKEPLVLDWDQARWSQKTNLMALYQERLVRSMKKLGAQTNVLAKLQQLIKNS